MAGLLDIAPRVESVAVGGSAVDVYGVSASGIAALLSRFPELRMMMSGKDVGIERLMEMGGDVVAAIIAAGCGLPGNPDAEAIAARLGIEEQADLLSAVLRLTMPGGVGPFVDKLKSLGGSLGLEASVAEPATKSPKPSKS
jgi:hypothetical protein